MTLPQKQRRLGTQSQTKKQFIRAFIMQGSTIVTLVDHPFEESGPMCTIILRDGTGRYCWQCVSAYLPFNERGVPSKTLEHCAHPVPLTTTPFHHSALPLESDRLSNVTKYLEERKSSYDVYGLAKEMCDRETNALTQRMYNLNYPIVLQPPDVADPYISNCKFQQGRQLMTHLGLLTFENWGHIYPLELTTNFFSQIKILDQVPERESHSISVVYIGKGQSLQDAMLNQNGSLDYQEFLSALGWGVHIPTHTGHLGGLDRTPSTHGTFTVYYSDYAAEVVFHVSTLIPNSSQADQPQKLRLIGGNSVAIIWTENPIENYEPDFGKGNKMHIVIHPVFKRGTYNLYQIKIVTKQKPQYKFWASEGDYCDVFGPAMDGMILCKDMMSVLVRETAVDACYVMNELGTGKESFKHIDAYQTRVRVISDIWKKFRIVESLESFFTNLLVPLPAKYVPPLRSSIPGRQERSVQRASRTPQTPMKGGRQTHLQMGSGRSSLDVRPPIPPPLDPKVVRKRESEDVDNTVERKKGKGRSRKGDDDDDGDDDSRKEGTRRNRSDQSAAWRTQPRGSESLAPPSKDALGAKISMSSQRMNTEKEGGATQKEEDPAKTPRPPKLSLPHLEDLEAYNF